LFTRAVKVSEFQLKKALIENAEESNLTKAVLSLFKEMSCFGLKLLYFLPDGKPYKVVYQGTLSCLKLNDFEFCQN
jgi:hypothetical protein